MEPEKQLDRVKKLYILIVQRERICRDVHFQEALRQLDAEIQR